MESSTLSVAARAWRVACAVVAAVLLVQPLGAPPAEAAFPGNNGKIAFSTYRHGFPQIYVMNADGSGQTRLTNNTYSDLYPAWSPDGTKIAFASDRDVGNNEIYVMNADGSNVTRLTDNYFMDGTPVWSPDGTRIAYSGMSESGGFEIWVMNADGSNPSILTNDPAQDQTPAWSPDGTKIAFSRWQDENYELFVMNADGTGQTRLTYSPGSGEIAPDWSPDGATILCVSVSDSNHELFVMNADGSNLTNLTNSSSFEGMAVWSPDGTKIAFSSSPSGSSWDDEIYVMNADGTGRTRLTSAWGPDFTPSWQPASGVDTTPPTITLASDTLTVWPPKHRYVALEVAQLVSAVSDDTDSSVGVDDVFIARVTSDEPEDMKGSGDGKTVADIVIAGDCRGVQLRAERADELNGRVYTIWLNVADASGNVGVATVHVHVPIQASWPAVDDGAAAGYTVEGCSP